MGNEDYSDMEFYILRSPAATAVGLLRPHFPSWRAQMVANGFPLVPAPMSSTGIQYDLAENLFVLLMKQAMPREIRKQRANRDAEHSLRNVLSYMRLPMFRERGRWKL